MSEEINRTTRQVIYLVACGLHSVVPDDENIADLDLYEAYKLAKRHSIASMVCMVLEDTELFKNADPEIKKTWLEAKNKAIRKNMLLDAERAQIFAEMDKAGIWHMPLKGIILQNYYPKYGMREMADNDILYDPAYQQELKKIMVGRGFTAVEVGRSAHDIYKKPPIYNFEMHTALFSVEHDEKWKKYYGNIKAKLVLNSDDPYYLSFTAEDFYVYIFTHASKHFLSAGTGLKTIIDLYVVNSVKENKLNREYITHELKKLGLNELEEKIRELAYDLFNHAAACTIEKLSEEEIEVLSYCLDSGSFGNAVNRTLNGVKKLHGCQGKIDIRIKLKYFIMRLFPSRAWCEHNYPFFYRHPWAMPGLWIYRLGRAIVFRKRILKEAEVVAKM